MTCKCPPMSPFLWAQNPRDSIFMSNPYFKPRGDTGKTGSQLVTEHVEKRRAKGEEPGFVKGISRKREEEMLKYRVFGVYSLAKSSTKPYKNKHEKT